jgi:hypothetical protein
VGHLPTLGYRQHRGYVIVPVPYQSPDVVLQKCAAEYPAFVVWYVPRVQQAAHGIGPPFATIVGSFPIEKAMLIKVVE